MHHEFSSKYARSRDQQDPLKAYRKRFHFPNPGEQQTIYFSGHSLGLQPRAARDAVELELAEWARYGVDGHFDSTNPWYSYHELLTPLMAGIVGAQDSEVVCMNSLTTNLHLLFVSFYRPTSRKYKIISEGKMFPSDRYLLETQTRFHGFDPDDAIIEINPRGGEGVIRQQDILDAIRNHADELALVFLGGVNFFTGQLFDMRTITAAAHAAGAVAGFDLAHAAGNVPLDLNAWDVDFAAWCSYKYLNAGPGNVGAIFVHERHATNSDLPRFGGWWGHDKERRFLMESGFTPMRGAEGWQLSNAPVFGMAVLKTSIDIFDEAGMNALRQKSKALTGYLEFVIDSLSDEFPDAGINLITSRDPEQRGSQLSFNMAGREKAFFGRMTAAGIVGDFREPCMIRIAPVPLYNSFEDVYEFGARMRQLLGTAE